ncbi:MAG: carboxypeptidase-like regulatory domain-containing protein, partial [Chitinophagaceae bacterium]|nr:carboxypeptidase-like regulatory domain-containing protein [Chitinophagaceae bacterium]
MQLTTLILLVFTLSLSASTNSQTITLKGKDISIERVIKEINNQTGYFVMARTDVAEAIGKVNVDVNKMAIADFMALLLKNKPFEFEIDAKTIFIRGKKPAAELSPGIEENPPPITGVIRDAEGNPISGVNIVIKGTKRGVVSDAYGNFRIDAKEGEVLVISSINYGTKQIKLGAGNAPLIVALDR